MAIPFFEAIIGEFSAESLSSGLSIFRAGGVRKFEHFGELSQAQIRAGLGEYFNVHIKFNTVGRCIQWMDCTCKDNRRRGLKCGHLAALCIYIDVEEHEFLLSLGMSPAGAEEMLNKIPDRFSDTGLFDHNHQYSSVASTSGNSLQEAADLLLPSKQKFEKFGASIEEDELESNASAQAHPLSGLKLKSLGYSKDPGVLIATIEKNDGREVRYRLGLEDSLALLNWPGSVSALSGRLLKEQEAGFYAKRVFRVSRNRLGQFQVEKRILVLNRAAELGAALEEGANEDAEKNVEKEFSYEALPKPHLGRSGIYIRKFGFLAYKDHFDSVREARWADYPNSAVLESEVAAVLFETGFERLSHTADVVLSESVKDLRVESRFKVEQLNVREGDRGALLVKADVVGESELASALPSSVTLFQIVSARKQGKQFVETEAGWIKVGEEFDWVAPKIDQKGVLHLSKLEFVRFKESLAKNSTISGQGELVRRLCAGLVSQAEIQPPDLGRTALQLRPYQEEGYRWLWWLYENRLGGLLADEMGLGKTHQAMALISGIGRKDPNAPPTLVVCPTSVIDHWLDKLNRFVPHTSIFCYYGATRKVLPRHNEYCVVVTSYGILLRDIELMCQREWSAVILDEAHLVKNQTTRTYQAACKISSHLRICLTGTPLENDLFELKTLFDYIVPGYLGPDTAFRKKFIRSASAQDPLATIELKRLVHPFKLRRTKAEVLSDLPEKIEDVRYCQLGAEQRKLYQQALKLKGQPILDALSQTDGHVPYVHVFAVITFLKQICNDPGLVHEDYENVSSGKLELFDEILLEAIESDQKVVVFSQYAKMVSRLSARLNEKGIKHVSLTGQSQKRGELIAAFQNDPEIKVFIGSLLAGGTGIDLTAASVVIHFDRWWNAAKENQATDRIHRIGQQKNVQVFKLVTRGTLEEHIDQIIERKRSTFEKYVEEDSEAFKNLTRDDLVKLLAPLQDAATESSERNSAQYPGGIEGAGGVQLEIENISDFVTID